MSYEYDKYISQHKENVAKAFYWLKDNLPELITEGCEHQICFGHDFSKNDTDEYSAYDAYFYGGNRSYNVVQDFNKAWLSHIHKNPHHWQHWILIHDEPNEDMTILEMPYNYILEMICDWWAFSWNKGNLNEIFSWYKSHGPHMKLNDKTRKTVEYVLDEIKRKLQEVQTNET